MPGNNGVNDEEISPLTGPVGALRTLSDDPLGVTASEQTMIRSALVSWRPLVVVLVPEYANRDALSAMTDTLGFSPTWTERFLGLEFATVDQSRTSRDELSMVKRDRHSEPGSGRSLWRPVSAQLAP